MPNDKKRRYKKPDMTRVDKVTVDYIYDAIENRKCPDEAIKTVREEIAEEDERLRKLAEKGIPY